MRALSTPASSANSGHWRTDSVLRQLFQIEVFRFLREKELLHKKRNTAGGDEIVLDVLRFIARLSVQIPDPHERIVLYYGLYSNASGRHRKRRDEKEPAPPATGFSRCDESEYSKSRRIRWAKLIAKVWKEDPLLCKKCGGKMRIISFITDPVVIDRILRHIG